VAIAVLFLVTKLPEVSEEMLNSSTVENYATDEFGNEIGQGPLYKQYNMIFGFIAQFCYVGAQVTIASFFINYATENATFTAAQASNLLSYALITFTVGRFVATGLATIFQADFLLMVSSCSSDSLNEPVLIETLGLCRHCHRSQRCHLLSQGQRRSWCSDYHFLP